MKGHKTGRGLERESMMKRKGDRKETEDQKERKKGIKRHLEKKGRKQEK